jgi:hypothetical protein
MKDIWFYEEYDSPAKKRKKISQGNVLAVFHKQGNEEVVDAIGAVFFHPNRPVTFCSASWGYLRNKCRRISEARAREIHSNLFFYLKEETP